MLAAIQDSCRAMLLNLVELEVVEAGSDVSLAVVVISLGRLLSEKS